MIESQSPIPVSRATEFSQSVLTDVLCGHDELRVVVDHMGQDDVRRLVGHLTAKADRFLSGRLAEGAGPRLFDHDAFARRHDTIGLPAEQV